MNNDEIYVKCFQGKREALQKYYNSIASSGSDFSFLSPVLYAPWLNEAAHWICSSKIVAEIGCGNGIFCAQCLANPGNLHSYYVIDLSQEMLASIRGKIQDMKSKVSVCFLNADIEDESFIYNFNHLKFEKIIAINLLQDVDITVALKNINRLLVSGGQFRGTFINRETQNIFWQEDDLYDPDEGTLYTKSALHENLGIKPFGCLMTKNKKQNFYRIQKYFSELEIRKILEISGFKESYLPKGKPDLQDYKICDRLNVF